MPELPEMETYKRLLNEHLAGKAISNIEVNREKSINAPASEFIQELKEKQIVKFERRAKHLIFKLDSGKSLLLHLMLGGWMFLGNEEDSPKRTKQVILSFGDQSLYFIGLRLGYLHLLDEQALQQNLAGLGPEPLDAEFTFPVFQEILNKKKGKLKTVLLDQQLISGIGNRYSDEICFEAKLRPAVKIEALNDRQMLDIFNSIRSVLRKAILLGGYMANPLYSGDQLTGGYNSHMLVHDRGGEPCKRCGGTIAVIELASRKCYYCPNCQEA